MRAKLKTGLFIKIMGENVLFGGSKGIDTSMQLNNALKKIYALF